MTNTTTTLTPAEDIKPGDLVVFLGATHRVVAVEPRTHPTVPAVFATARWEDGQGLTLTRGMLVETA